MSGGVRLNGEPRALGIPLLLSWDQTENPLPIRPVRPGPHHRGQDAPPWLATGTEGRVFPFSAAVSRLCADIATRCDELRHVDVSRLLFAFTQARSARLHGLQARVTPLRFRDGRLIRRRRGVTFQVQRYFVDDHEVLYLVTFCLPRFLDQSFDEKFITLFHELYHIGPAFDGDLRRHPGRCTLHTRSKRAFDAHMADLARAYLASGPDPELHAFLRLSFSQLQYRHGAVVAVSVPHPKIVPVDDPTAQSQRTGLRAPAR